MSMCGQRPSPTRTRAPRAPGPLRPSPRREPGRRAARSPRRPGRERNSSIAFSSGALCTGPCARCRRPQGCPPRPTRRRPAPYDRATSFTDGPQARRPTGTRTPWTPTSTAPIRSATPSWATGSTPIDPASCSSGGSPGRRASGTSSQPPTRSIRRRRSCCARARRTRPRSRRRRRRRSPRCPRHGRAWCGCAGCCRRHRCGRCCRRPRCSCARRSTSRWAS